METVGAGPVGLERYDLSPSLAGNQLGGQSIVTSSAESDKIAFFSTYLATAMSVTLFDVEFCLTNEL